MFGTTKDEVTGVWRRIHNVELRELYLSPNIIRVINLGRLRWAEYVACMGERSADRVSVGNPEDKIPLGRLRHRWEDNF